MNTINHLTDDLHLPSPLERIEWPDLTHSENTKKALQNIQQHELKIFCKRDDLIHPIISGNKWRKLAKSIDCMRLTKTKHILSFGGGHSNHLHALAFVCYQLGLQFTAIVRGNYTQGPTDTILDLQKWGCTIVYTNKIDYQKRQQQDYCAALMKHYKADMLIPEGGSQIECFHGVAEIAKEYIQQQIKLNTNISHIVLPVASGGTIAGLIQYFSKYALMHPHETMPQIIGIAMLKGEGYLESLVRDLLKVSQQNTNNNWKILHDFHHGGYAKKSPSLSDFVEEFNQGQVNKASLKQLSSKQPGLLQLEPVYSGKCFYALNELLAHDYFKPKSQIMLLHTGGLRKSV